MTLRASSFINIYGRKKFRSPDAEAKFMGPKRNLWDQTKQEETARERERERESNDEG
jgi:hypothetical protein